jgi:3-phosphoglycerate kinase
MAKLTVKDLDFKGKKVIVRVDFNVPLDKKTGAITDDIRIREALPTIKYILDKNPRKLILMSHMGRPDGKVIEGLRMNVVAKKLAELLGKEVEKLDDCVGDEIKKKIDSSSRQIVLLENLRFHAEEEEGDENFARQLASLADVYVNDAFGTAHRSHASTTVIAKFLPSCLGLLMEKEVNSLAFALNPEKPYAVILGGAKVSDKIPVIVNLMKRANKILIGGAMAYTFLKSRGQPVGKSKVEDDKLDLAGNILKDAKKNKVEIILPVDHVVVEAVEKPETKKIVDVIPDGFMGVDIGPKTVSLFNAQLAKAKTILWNGPVGIFENPNYAGGTKEIALFLAKLKNAKVIVGGGDSASAAKEFGVAKVFYHVSTGGGASLEFLEGKELPGIAVIKEK